VTIGVNGHKPIWPRFGHVVFLLTIALCSQGAIAQEVDVPAGPSPGELQCPPHKHHNKHKRHKHNEETLEPPGTEELADLPVQNELQPQEVALDGRGPADASHPYSIAIWGDSHIASNYFAEEMMRALGFAQDKVQSTFIPPDMDRPGVRLPIRKHCQDEGWNFEYAYVSRQVNGAFTKGLVNLKSHVPGSYLWVDFRTHSLVPNLRALDILFAPPAPGQKVLIGLIVDDGAEQMVELEQGGRGIVHLRAEQPISTVKLRLVEGTVVLQGFVPQYVEKPAVYLDNFGIPGATMHGWKTLDAGYLKERGNDVPYNLVIIEYGTNEGNDRSLDLSKYKSDLQASLENMRRAYPGASCVLIGPPDRGVLVKRRRGKKYRNVKPAKVNILKYSRIHQQIGDIQHAVGEEYSCAYWSWQDAMGGPGSAYRWMHHSPVLMGRDITHMTVSGLQISARRFTEDAKLSKYLHNGE
jgi:hypothetical protein